MKYLVFYIPSLIILSLLSACGDEARELKYAAYEKVGIEKRDLFKRELRDTRKSQTQAKEQMEDALDRLREMHDIKGGDLEKTYDKLKKDYDRCVKRADSLHSDVQSLDQIATDLFKEWETEIPQIEDASLRTKSSQLREETIKNYGEMISSLRNVEKSMDPVLKAFNTHVLYLKHNLNAKAIQSLGDKGLSIEKDIGSLVDQMNKSIEEADRFIANYEKQNS